MAVYNKEQAKNAISKIVENFHKDIDKLKVSTDSYEAQIEDNYVKPLFSYLNWNIHNTGLPHGKEVFVVQYHIKRIGKRPDYLLRVPDNNIGKMKHILFMEAKHPKYDLFKDLKYIRQCYLYANSTLCKTERPEKRVPLSLLTDFEEFRLFDCRDSDPLLKNKLELFNRRIVKGIDWKYLDYINNFDILWDLFEYNQVCKGSLDELRVSDSDLMDSRKTPDFIFLESLKDYRIKLAQSMYNINNDLSEEILTSASQLLLNRIVFIKMLADKDLESDYLSKIIDSVNSTGKTDISFYEACQKIFEELNKTFNGSVFKKREELDYVKVRDKDLRDILDSIRPEKAIYSLDAMPVRVIGTMYEEFLGDVIVKKGRGISSKQKPDVRKAGGVYYTPEYIVDYITENALSKYLTNCKKPEDVQKIKIIDPACGSGSFLISVYDILINWHMNYYKEIIINELNKGVSFNKIQQKYINDISISVIDENSKNFTISLTILKKSNILVNSIFGIDIDDQAVEVAKFSLSLKAVEDYYDRQELYKEIGLFKTTILPDLSNNIKCGNTLIDDKYFSDLLLDISSEIEERKNIKPFNWYNTGSYDNETEMWYDRGFPDIMNNGGFDIVIGNPPYRHEKDYKELLDPIANTEFGKKWKSPRMDLWYYFVHKGIELLKENGILSFIVNAYWLKSTGSEKLISDIRNNTNIEEIFFLSNYKVFNNVSGEHLIIRLCKTSSKLYTKIKYAKELKIKDASFIIDNKQNYFEYVKEENQLFTDSKIDIKPYNNLIGKINRNEPLEKYGIIRQGIAENPASINAKTNEKFKNKFTTGEGVFTLNNDEIKKLKIPKDEKLLIRPYHDLCDLGRYFINSEPSLNLIYSTKITCPDINEFPVIKQHLYRFKKIMDERRETKTGSIGWWHLHWPRDEQLWKSTKIISLQMGKRPSFLVAEGSSYVSFSTNIFVPNDNNISLYYYVALLNSKLLWYWYLHNAKKRGVGLEINVNVLSKSPIKVIDFNNKEEYAIYEHIIAKSKKLHEIQTEISITQSIKDKNICISMFNKIDEEIDKLIYILYNLNDTEIKYLEKEISESLK